MTKKNVTWVGEAPYIEHFSKVFKGMEFENIETRDKCLERLMEEKKDLILVDSALGPDIIKTLRKMSANTSTPIISTFAMMSDAGPERHNYLEAGAGMILVMETYHKNADTFLRYIESKGYLR